MPASFALNNVSRRHPSRQCPEPPSSVNPAAQRAFLALHWLWQWLQPLEQGCTQEPPNNPESESGKRSEKASELRGTAPAETATGGGWPGSPPNRITSAGLCGERGPPHPGHCCFPVTSKLHQPINPAAASCLQGCQRKAPLAVQKDPVPCRQG